MFKLREAHFEAFQPITDKLLIERITQHLRDHHAKTVGQLPDHILREMVETGIRRSRIYGLTWEYSITYFVTLMFEIAPNFDQHPAIHRVLCDPILPPDERMDLLTERVSDEEWQEANRNYDRHTWFPDLREARV